jgi:very-short-patch-repair endonuclease
MPKTLEIFKEQVKKLTREDYQVIGDYINSKHKIKMKHILCGHEYDTPPGNFLMGNRCPKCNGTPKKTTESFKKEVAEIFGDEYEVIGEYKNNRSSVAIKHRDCGRTYEPYPNNFLRKQSSCRFCSRERIADRQRKATNQFKKEVLELVRDEYAVVGEYGKNCFTPIIMKHNDCGKEFSKKPNYFIQKPSCPFCSKNNPKSTDKFKLEVKNLVDTEYTVLGEYKRTNTKILMRHETCGEEYEVKPSHFLSDGRRCARCFNYNNEKEILNLLEGDFNLKVIRNKKFEKLLFKRELKLDFYLPELNAAIEYDGEQHFFPIYGKEELEVTKKRDRIKDEFCEKNNIRLLRIPYTKRDKKKEIIAEFLKK